MAAFARRTRVRARRRTRQYVEHPGRVQRSKCSRIRVRSRDLVRNTGYLPAGWSVTKWGTRRESEPRAVEDAAKRSMATQVEAMLAFHCSGVPVVDYGNNLRQLAKDAGDAFDYPGFVQAYVRPLFCRGKGPFRWAALSGDPQDIYRTDEMVKELIPDDPLLHNWLDMARERIRFQGLPARICWLGLGQRHRVGLAFNRLVAEGAVRPPS